MYTSHMIIKIINSEDPSNPLFSRIRLNTFKTSSCKPVKYCTEKCRTEKRKKSFFFNFLWSISTLNFVLDLVLSCLNDSRSNKLLRPTTMSIAHHIPSVHRVTCMHQFILNLKSFDVTTSWYHLYIIYAKQCHFPLVDTQSK